MNDKSQVEYILNDIRTIVDNVIIKLTNKADEYETVDSKREADMYVTACMERDTFNSYRQYPIDVLVNAGITDASLLMEYTEDRTKIPRNKRKDVLRCMRKQVIDEYTEQNDYYRELIGKPSINTPESEYIYLTEEEMEYYNIDEVRPIHDYPMEIQLKLERMTIPRLIEQYPERTYLSHMGSKTVDLVRARQARNFEIIFTDVRLDNVFMRAFFNTYDFCREYFMSMIYNKQFKARYDLYDNYIGMHIMIMTIQRLIVDTIKLCIDRDFYDLISIRKLFNVYGLPFYEDLPLDYQRLICKNVNWLIRCKSTDKVLYDVANTLFYERLEIHKFYLIKDRKFDDNGEPIFKYKFIATDEKYDIDAPDYYFKCETTGKVYKLIVKENNVYCNETDDVLSDFITDKIYVKDYNNNIYEVFVKDGELKKTYYNKIHDGIDEMFLYDELNSIYSLTIQSGEFVLEKVIVDDIEYGYLTNSPENVYIMSNNGFAYEIYIENDKLATREINMKSDKFDSSIRVINEYTGEKMLLYMDDEHLCTETINDDQSANVLYLYNDEGDRYKISPSDGKLQSFEFTYKLKKVLDYENMFDVYFQSTEILETNVSNAIEQKKFRYDYHEVTDEDVYWWETDELKKELYEREYNYIDTKYIGVNLMQNLTKLLYETSYYLNLLIDHKDTTVPMYYRILNSDAMKTGTDYLYITLDRITTTPISIFDTVMVLCALVSKKNGMKGNIIVKSPAQILSVLGFNFDLNFDLIRENIKKYKRTFKNQEILKYLDLLDIQKVSDIDILFNNFRNFSEFCEDVIANTTDINEYKAYKELLKVITVRKDSAELFRKSDGEIATTYLDYLYDKIPVIAKFIDELHKDKTGIYIDHAIGKLNELIPEIEYLYSMNGTNNNIINAIIGLINFFKSYTVDLRNLNVMYMFDNKRLNKIYMIDDPRLFITLFPEEDINKYPDTVTYKSKFDKYDNLVIYRKSNTFDVLYPKHKFDLYHKIQSISTDMQYNDTWELNYKDVMEIYNKFGCKDYMELAVFKLLFNTIYHGDKFNTEGFLKFYKSMNINDNVELFYKDIIDRIIVNDTESDVMPINYKQLYSNNIYEKNIYNLEHCIDQLSVKNNTAGQMLFFDIINEFVNSKYTDKLYEIKDNETHNSKMVINGDNNQIELYESFKIIYED